jgi:hypothetical protein
MTTPDELRWMTIEHFEHLLERTTDPDERARIQRFLEEERCKADSAYPASRADWKAHP